VPLVDALGPPALKGQKVKREQSGYSIAALSVRHLGLLRRLAASKARQFGSGLATRLLGHRRVIVALAVRDLAQKSLFKLAAPSLETPGVWQAGLSRRLQAIADASRFAPNPEESVSNRSHVS
jgi:hypothetical protein